METGRTAPSDADAIFVDETPNSANFVSPVHAVEDVGSDDDMPVNRLFPGGVSSVGGDAGGSGNAGGEVVKESPAPVVPSTAPIIARVGVILWLIRKDRGCSFATRNHSLGP